MEDEAPIIYGLESQARALAAHTAESEQINFLVGTQSLRSENQVHLVHFDDENNTLNKTVYLHKDGEIWFITSCPLEANIVGTIYNKTSATKAELKACLWQFPVKDSSSHSDEEYSQQQLIRLCDFETTAYGDMKSMLWHPSGEDAHLITIMDSHFVLWDMAESGSSVKEVSSAALEGKGQPRFSAGCWNPHHNCTQLMTASDNSIRGWDLRSTSQTMCIDNAHGQLVRDLNFNPNKQYCLASCGDDCKTKFWDIRHTVEPLKVLCDHSHWVWSVRYNHFHDQLVLTSSSDSRVILHNVQSLSSEPLGHMGDEDDDKKQQPPPPDGIICTYEEHEDSVYTVEWSAADPWTFASLSYDGRLVINRVPRATKYRILL